MSKTANRAIWLSFVSLVAAAVITAGVVFAWMATNKNVRGSGVGVRVFDDPNTGVVIETVNDGRSRDKATIYAGGILELGLNVIAKISSFTVEINFQKRLNEWKDFESQAWRNDLLNGQYRYRQASGFMETDFDIDEYLREYSLSLTEDEIFEAKLRFLKYFADKYNLLDHMKLRMTSITASNNTTAVNKELVLYPGDEYDTKRIFRLSDTSGLPAEYATGFPEGTKINMRLEFTNNIDIGVMLTDEDIMILDSDEIKFPVGLYSALNYNCYTFQEIGLVLTS